MFAPVAPWVLGDIRTGIERIVRQANYDPTEQVIDDAMRENGYKIVRQSFRAGLPYGVLGKGTYGMVYRASKNNKEYGVKMIERASVSQPLIDKEIEILRTLNHPSIVSLGETFHFKSKDWMFLAMEFVEGGDLLSRLTQQPQLFQESMVRAIMFHMCCALSCAHEIGILHRDIKPENILLRKDGFPKVADFGISRHLNVDQSEFAYSMAGTPAYIAPEIKKRAAYRYPADTYSLGLVLRDMMAKVSAAEWIVHCFPPHERSKFVKQWPPGMPKPEFSGALGSMVQDMTQQVPSRRPSMFEQCRLLKRQAQADPAPHPLFSVRTFMAKGPPMSAAKQCCVLM